MYQQVSTLYFRFRFLFAGAAVLGFLVLVSSVITLTGAHTILDSRTSPRMTFSHSSAYDSPNTITVGAYDLLDNTKRFALSAGTGFYAASRSIAALAARSCRTIAHATAVTAQAFWNGTVTRVRGIGNGMLFILRAPGKIVGSVTRGHTVSALIRPADNTRVPVIDAETSTAILKQLNAQKQQEIRGLLAAQMTANQGLAGSVVAGNPQHSGYPTRWDHATQDSRLDSWGMYNRECVSYAAWKVYQTFGYMPYWGGVGNANEWVRNAKVAGIPTGATPKVHAVAISMHGYYGHAMWIEAVNGNMIYVSQYNYDLQGHYSEMWANSNNFTYIYFD